jgi:D-glycero-alpha-D-manno-heptose 1-phosphate guanylyltransferase
MISEVIILAGGLGTRLRNAVPDLPKCMAPVKGKPFLHYVIEHFKQQGIEHFIFSLGYMNESVEAYLKESYFDLSYSAVIEEEPLGTGGAIKLCCAEAKNKNVLVANGDTLFALDVKKLAGFHAMCGADCTLSLKKMFDFDRYGVVELSNAYSIIAFKEKAKYAEGLINAGVYALNTGKFLQEELPDKFSFEKDYLEKHFTDRRMFGVVQDVYFIDIGIPNDYEKAQKELS